MKCIVKRLFFSLACLNLGLNARVIHITSVGQLTSIIRSNTNVVIKFYADFCQPCKSFAPVFSQISDDPSLNSIIFTEVNIEQMREITNAYSIQSIPSIIYVKNGQIIARETGGKSASRFKSLLKNYFSL